MYIYTCVVCMHTCMIVGAAPFQDEEVVRYGDEAAGGHSAGEGGEAAWRPAASTSPHQGALGGRRVGVAARPGELAPHERLPPPGAAKPVGVGLEVVRDLLPLLQEAPRRHDAPGPEWRHGDTRGGGVQGDCDQRRLPAGAMWWGQRRRN